MSKTYSLLILLLILPILFGCGNSKVAVSSSDAPKMEELKTEKKSISQTLKDNSHLTVDKRVALYHKLKKENPEGYNFENEDELTMYGYGLLWDNNIKEALEIFKLIVEQFPNSSNPYDSLGEAYFASGEMDLALVNYQKSLDMNPDNFNAEDYIERIKFPNKKPITPADKFVKIYSIEQYRNDLDQLGKKLREVHPNALKFITEEDFLKVIEQKKKLITDQTTYGHFIWHCSEVIASINCSHTSMGSFFQESDMLPGSNSFPLQTRWVNDQLFVVDHLVNSDKVKLNDEIQTINDVPVADLVQDIYRHIQSQGTVETKKKHFFNTWASAMIPYALGFPDTYRVSINGNSQPIQLNKATTIKPLFNDPSIKSCPDNLCFEVLDNQTGLMTISSFNYYPWNNLNVFTEFMDARFKEIKEKGIEHLIIDVRFNGGGSQQSSIHLLKYLVDKPFSYYSHVEFDGKDGKVDGEEIEIPFDDNFTGELYFLIDGNGNSTTGHFMSIVKALKLGDIVGEELGSNHFCSAGQTVCRLANTKLQYYVANNTHVSLTSSPNDEKGVLPDHFVTQSIDDYLNRVDAVMAYTIKLIKQ